MTTSAIHYMTSDGVGSPWVGNELRIVTRAGVPVVLHSMRTPTKLHFDAQWAKDLQNSSEPLYPIRIGRFVWANLAGPFVFGAAWFAALGNALLGERENLRARSACLWHFFVAVMWAFGQRGGGVAHVHSQWVFSSGSIAMYGAWLLGVPFSFTGHAVDLTRQRVALRDKIRRAKFIIAISEWHRAFYIKEDKGATPDLNEKIHTAYCGIYCDEMVPASAAARAARKGQPFTILSAGRLIGKKGFPYVIGACKVLQERGRDFRCVIAGSGPDEAMLRGMIASGGLEGVVSMTGRALKQEKIPEFMHGGDCFVLACVWASDGDVDGLPQLTMEAMGCGLPSITTKLVGNPDLVIHEKTGLLVEPEPSEKLTGQLADAFERMMDDGVLRERLAEAGRAFIFERFDITKSLEPLIAQYRSALGYRAEAGVAAEATKGAIA